MTESQSRMMTSHYYAKVAYDDHAIGVVLRRLQEKGLMDNTWVVYTSDHGEMLGDHRLCQKVVFYEGALNVPHHQTTPRNRTMDRERSDRPLRHYHHLARRWRCRAHG